MGSQAAQFVLDDGRAGGTTHFAASLVLFAAANAFAFWMWHEVPKPGAASPAKDVAAREVVRIGLAQDPIPRLVAGYETPPLVVNGTYRVESAHRMRVSFADLERAASSLSPAQQVSTGSPRRPPAALPPGLDP